MLGCPDLWKSNRDGRNVNAIPQRIGNRVILALPVGHCVVRDKLVVLQTGWNTQDNQ